MGKNTVKAKQWLDKDYGKSAQGKSPIIDWYAEFKRGQLSGQQLVKAVQSDQKLNSGQARL